VNGALVNRGELDHSVRRSVIYAPTSNGSLRLTGADFSGSRRRVGCEKAGPPELMGQLFHYFEFPSASVSRRFYTLHVWAWKDNPNGAFVNWHPPPPNVYANLFGALTH